MVASLCRGKGGPIRVQGKWGWQPRCPDLLGVVVTEVVVVVVRMDHQRSTLGQPQLRSLKVEGGREAPSVACR